MTRRRSTVLQLGVLLATLMGVLPHHASSQLASSLLDDATEVRSLHFRFLDSQSFSHSQLAGRIGLTGRGRGYSLARAFGFIPFVPTPQPHPFDPLNLQRDVARLREFYRGAGFPDAVIRYDVALDQGSNLVDVDFLISEGRPRTLASIEYAGPPGGPLEEVLPVDLVPEWRRFVAGQNAAVAERLGDQGRAQIVGSPLRWLMDRGYPFPTGDSRLDVDSTGFQVRLRVRIDPGPRSRVGSVEVEGATSVAPGVVLREVSIREGDWFSAEKVSEGRQRIFSLGVFNMALADVVRLQDPDSSVQVLFQVREGRPRSVSGEVGYTNTGGLALGGEWAHQNFWGGARTLSVTGSAKTGAFAVLTESPDQFFRGAVSLLQPFVFVPGLSFVASPFAEYRDDYRDRSWEAGVDGTLTYHLAPLQAISLRYRLSNRNVLDSKLDLGGGAVPALLGSGGSVGLPEKDLVVSVFTLSGTLQQLDDPANPRRGFVLQPSLEATAPPGFPTNEYFKADLWGSLFRPLGGRGRLAASVRVGRLFPFGGSVPAVDGDGLSEFVDLRDVNLTAGGPTDVRGWGSRLMGPKLPDIESNEAGDTVTYSASRYLPVGGLARISGGLEVQFPLSRSGSNLMGHIFLDGGRVWTPDSRFAAADAPYNQDKAYYSTGAGIGIATPVGPIRVSAGYKLNPSALDLRDPGEVLALLLEGRSILEAPVRNSRRFQIHLTVGRSF